MIQKEIIILSGRTNKIFFCFLQLEKKIKSLILVKNIITKILTKIITIILAPNTF